jgi:16S rRNA (uracil1498-N3)-methyltransferase
MSRRRFIADEVSAGRALLLGAHAEHLSRVLRARPGQEFEIAGEGRVRLGRIVLVAHDRVEFELGEEVSARELAAVTLYLAVFKFDRMEWAMEKCTELGVARICPIVCARTDAHLAKGAEKRVERWRRLVLQAAEQSRRPVPPEISAPVKLSPAMLDVSGARIVLAESERELLLRDALKKNFPAAEPSAAFAASQGSGITLAVGPEGGWTEPELKLFSTRAWTRASLGPAILRAETAAIAALAVVMSESY